jgi:uncharacterized protein (TIGR00369 family)
MDEGASPQEASTEAAARVTARVTASFERQGLMRLLGASLGQISPGRVQVTLPRRAEVSQQHGYVHAGATSAIADSAGGYAALTMMASGADVLTVEYKLNLIAPAEGDFLEATGTVLKSGRTLSVCQLEVHAVTGEKRRLVAAGQQTLITLPSAG